MKIFTTMCAAAGLLSAILLLASCSSYNVYRYHLWEGKNFLIEERYPEARDALAKAAGEQNRAAPRAYAATVSYKLGDIAAARRYLEEAENAPGKDYVDLRITAYKALILFRENKQQEGMAALRDYLNFYRHLYPLVTIEDVRDMWKSGRVDLPKLEQLLDQQLATYDRDMFLAFSAGIGYYNRCYPETRPSGFMLD